MSDKYKINDPSKAYFVTMTVIGWIDLFTRKKQKVSIVQSLEYCQKHRGLEIFAYCLMPSHLHLICKAEDGCDLSSILRD